MDLTNGSVYAEEMCDITIDPSGRRWRAEEHMDGDATRQITAHESFPVNDAESTSGLDVHNNANVNASEYLGSRRTIPRRWRYAECCLFIESIRVWCASALVDLVELIATNISIYDLCPGSHGVRS